MKEFKVGDKVKRIRNSFKGMNINDIGTIIKVSRISIQLKEYEGSHEIKNFTLYEKKSEIVENYEIF